MPVDTHSAAPLAAMMPEVAPSPALGGGGGGVRAADRGGSAPSPSDATFPTPDSPLPIPASSLLTAYLQGTRLSDIALQHDIPLDDFIDWLDSPEVAAFLARLTTAAETQRHTIRALSAPACLNALALTVLDESTAPAERRRAATLILSGRSTPRATRTRAHRTPKEPGAPASGSPSSPWGGGGGGRASRPEGATSPRVRSSILHNHNQRSSHAAADAPGDNPAPFTASVAAELESPSVRPNEAPEPRTGAATVETEPPSEPPCSPPLTPSESALLATLSPEKAASYMRHRATRDRILAFRAFLASRGIREPPAA